MSVSKDGIRDGIKQSLQSFRNFLAEMKANGSAVSQNSDRNTDISTWFDTPSGDGANVTNVDPINTADVINASAIGKVSPQTAKKAKAVGRQETPADYVGKVGEIYSKLLTEPTLKSVAGYDMDRRRAIERRIAIDSRLEEIAAERALAQNPYATVQNQQEYDYKTGTYKPVVTEPVRSFADIQKEEDSLISKKA